MAGLQEVMAEADLDQIIADLSGSPKQLPQKALYQAREHWEQFRPKLLVAMRQAVEDWKADKNPGDIAFFGVFLCTEMAARESLPVILEMLRLPGDGPFDMFGDAIHEVVPQTLATLAGDQIDLLDEMVGDPAINEYVRWSIGKTFTMLVRDGHLSHEEAVLRLRRHLTRILEEASAAAANDCEFRGWKSDFGPTLISETLYSLLPHDGVDDMVKACELGLIDKSLFGGPKEIRKRAAKGLQGLEEEFQHLNPSRLKDTVTKLSSWGCYRETEKRRRSPQPGDSTTWTRLDANQREAEPHSSTTITRDKPRVPRNDPCPCRSGKKFKNCCGRS